MKISRSTRMRRIRRRWSMSIVEHEKGDEEK
jgi:hypothetical protein